MIIQSELISVVHMPCELLLFRHGQHANDRGLLAWAGYEIRLSPRQPHDLVQVETSGLRQTAN